MMKTRLIQLAWILLWCSPFLHAEVMLPRLIQDGMVLQRGEGTRIWGRADAGETVVVTFQHNVYEVNPDGKGDWIIEFRDLVPGGPFHFNLESSLGQVIHFPEVYVGDVWVCSGQSNMVIWMKRVKYKYAEDIRNAEDPWIRHFDVPDIYDFNVVHDDFESGEWKESTPETVMDFSAVAYFFARTIRHKEEVPIGLINCAVGGTPVQSWMSEEALGDFPSELEEARKWKDSDVVEAALLKNKTSSDAWSALVENADKGLRKGKFLYANPRTDVSRWKPILLPGNFNQNTILAEPGVVWLRKEIEINSLEGMDHARLWLGRIVDANKVFINGEFVGEITYRYPPSIYDIPINILRQGTNTIVARVVVNGDEGGFIMDKPYYLELGSDKIGLDGEWKAKQFTVAQDAPSTVFVQWKPLGLYNGLVAPLTPYNIRGAIWYQGEANTHDPGNYAAMFKRMIVDWRTHWHAQPDFPFLFVQLANLGEPPEQPGDDNWALLREAQADALVLPQTGMAVSYDVGEWNDIHPLDKKTVGYRLSLCARSIAYGEPVIYSGPQYVSHTREGGKLRVTFTDTGDGLVPTGTGAVNGFAIAGPDGVFHWADGSVEGDSVVLHSPEVPVPVHVRYAWAMNPAAANLTNSAGLPAPPFRTDR